MLKVKKNHIPNLIQRFKELDKAKFKVGYWETQGRHPSGLTYPTLFTILSYGSSSAGIVARPVLDLEFSTFSPLDKNLMLKNKLKLYFSNIKSKTPRITITKMLSAVAGDYVEKTRNSFGDLSKLASNTPFTIYLKQRAGVSPSNNPLVWTGDLRSNLSYSINGQPIVTP